MMGYCLSSSRRRNSDKNCVLTKTPWHDNLMPKHSREALDWVSLGQLRQSMMKVPACSDWKNNSDQTYSCTRD